MIIVVVRVFLMYRILVHVLCNVKKFKLCFPYLSLQSAQCGKKRDIEGADLAESSEPSRKAKRLDHEDYSPPD